ncbi:MAG: hypothetical protein H6625_12985 [Bdellovibrionaceae bacterium]|nr:hypothetical protein [Pseudobdellovibrionaceae bacterium]
MKIFVIILILPLFLSKNALASISICNISLQEPLVAQLNANTNFKKLVELYQLNKGSSLRPISFFDFKKIVAIPTIQERLPEFVVEILLGDSPYHFSFNTGNDYIRDRDYTDAFDSFNYLSEMLGKKLYDSKTEGTKNHIRSAFRILQSHASKMSENPTQTAIIEHELSKSFNRSTSPEYSL